MDYKDALLMKITSHSAVIGVIGLGYVGLPLALTFAEKGFRVIGFDTDETKIPLLMKGESYIKHIAGDRIQKSVDSSKFEATSDFTLLSTVDCIIICVPTPLDEHQAPDLTYIRRSAEKVQQYLRPGQLVVLESSTYPGTTEEILLPLFQSPNHPIIQSSNHTTIQPYNHSIIQSSNLPGSQHSNIPSFQYSNSSDSNAGFNVGTDFFLAFSPEREDPGNANFNTSTIPKIVGGMTPACLEVAKTLYDQVIVKTVPVSSPRAAEAAKLLENIYRSVNIALINELKMVFDRMDIDIWEVIEAAKTKPFGFHPFYPGPGLGGHCIPIDPFYLTWKAREYDINTKFIELAGEINTNQPYYVVEKSIAALSGMRKPVAGSRILILGVSYKKNIDDMRESPSLKLIEILKSKGAIVDYSDPYIPKLPASRKYNFEMSSVDLTSENLQSFDLVLLSTDHDLFNYSLIAQHSKLIIDTRNAFASRQLFSNKIIKA